MAANAVAIESQPMAGEGSVLKRRAMPWLLVAPGLAVTILFLLLPLVFLIVMSFSAGSTFLTGASITYTVSNYVVIFTQQSSLIRTTVFQAAMSAILDLIFGFPFAYFLIRKVWYRDLVRAMMSFPLFGALYLSFGLSFLLLPNTFFGGMLVSIGINPVTWLYSTPTVLFALALGTFPFMVVNIATALQNVDIMLEEAAATLGASSLQTFWRVLLPLTRAGILSGLLMAFGWNLGVYVVPLILGGTADQNVLAVQMYIKGVKNSDYGMAAAEGIVLMLLASVVTYVSLRYSRGALAK